MAKRHQIHHLHFIILLIILTLISAFILFFSFNRQYQIYSVVFFAVSYFLWGVAHHHKHKDLHLEVAIEYFLIAALGAAFLIAILLKA